MTLRLLSGNLTVSILTKQLKDTWSLKIKNNLSQDGILFDLNEITDFKLVIGDNENSVITNYEIDYPDFINVELDLNLVKKYIDENDVAQIYAVLEMAEHEEIVEVLAWNGTIISHVLTQITNSRVGVGRNSNNLFVGWSYPIQTKIEKVSVSDDLLVLGTNDFEEHKFVLKDKNNKQYLFIYDSSVDKYVLHLNELVLKESTEFIIHDLTTNLPVSIDENILFNEYSWQYKAIQFDFDNLGKARITILNNFAFVSSLRQNLNSIDLQINMPFNSFGIPLGELDDYILELALEENKTAIYINNIDEITLKNNTLLMETIIKFNSLIPYGEHDVFLRLLDKNMTVLKKFHVYLGMQRINFFNNQDTTQFTVVETPTVKNSPIKLRRIDETFKLSEINKYSADILDSRLKRQTAEYVTYRENLPITKDTILYESFFGALSDNPLALFKTIYERDIHKQYTHIWVVSDMNLKGLLSNYDSSNIVFVKYNSSEYLRWLAIAEHIVFNTSTTFPFATREGQKVLQTWHGVPLKTLGHDMEQARGLNRNVIRSMSQATIFTNPNSYTESKVLDTLDFADIHIGKRMLVSYPRQQRILKAKNEGFKDYLSKVMPINVNKKIALYAPTWRGSNGNYKNVVKEYSDAINLINKYLPNDYQLLFKPHKNATSFFKDNQSIVIVPDWIDVNEVLSVTDLLISDYSSIIFDFYFTGKPVINWMYDKDDYAKNNGFYSEIFTELIWPTNNENKLSWMLSNLNKYPHIENPFIEVNDHDVEKIADVWINPQKHFDMEEHKKDVILYIVYASDVHNDKVGIAKKVNGFVKQNFDKVVALLHVGDYVKSDEDFFNSLSKDVRNFYRAGQPGITNAEYIVMQKIKYGKFMSVEDKNVLQSFAYRELQREVGNISIAHVKPLKTVKNDDWATKAMVTLENKTL